MKKLLIAFGIIIISSNLHAQVQKGAILTGGSISYNGTNNKDEFSVNSGFVLDEFKRNFIAVRPQIGFFRNESTLLGIGLTYEHNSMEQLSSFNGSPNTPFVEKSNVIFINPYLTKFSKLTDKFYFTTTINLLAGFGKGKYGENDELETNIFELRANVTPGLTYFISSKWALRGSIGQLFFNRKQEKIATDIGLSENPKNVDNNYGLNISFNTFSIGFQYYLNNNESE
jgi:hypothetical protein